MLASVQFVEWLAVCRMVGNRLVGNEVTKIQGENVKAAGVLLLTRSNPRKFLMMRHAARWDLPKGHCEPGEKFKQAAQREMHEETGISPESCEFVEDFRFDLEYEVTYRKRPGRVFQKKVRYFLAMIDEPVKIQLTEHEGFQWWDWEPPHLIQTQTIDPVLAAVEDYLSDNPP